MVKADVKVEGAIGGARLGQRVERGNGAGLQQIQHVIGNRPFDVLRLPIVAFDAVAQFGKLAQLAFTEDTAGAVGCANHLLLRAAARQRPYCHLFVGNRHVYNG